MGEATVILGGALDALAGMQAGSVDAVVTDPPAGISFMGKGWDSFGGRSNGNAARDRAAANRGPGAGNQPFGYSGSALPKKGERAAFLAFLTPVMAECLRVCRPGAVALVWALPRTSHWTGTALEDAGWQIEDRIAHLFGQGFPKHRSKLKPACEDWWVCRKPGPKWLGVDECRISTTPEDAEASRGGVERMSKSRRKRKGHSGWQRPWMQDDARLAESYRESIAGSAVGRWPANVCLSHIDGPDGCRPVGTRRVRGTNPPGPNPGGLRNGYHGGGNNPPPAQDYTDADGTETVEDWTCHPECPVRLLDEQSGMSSSSPSRRNRRPRADTTQYRNGGARYNDTAEYADTGNASRFFYCAKASRKDRGEGNDHPTVKSTALMRWLVKLACPAGGLVLDPFAGSGTTGVACLETGRRFIGVECDPHYHEIATRRLAGARLQGVPA